MPEDFTMPAGVPVPVAWNRDRTGIRLLDQTRLPAEEIYLDITTVEEMVEAIQSLRVRGPEGKQIKHYHAVVAPALGKPYATPYCGVVLHFVRRGRVKTYERA